MSGGVTSPAEIAALLRAAEGLELLSVTFEGTSLTLRGGSGAAQAGAAAPLPVSADQVLRSPAAGVFCPAYPGEAAAGRDVRAGAIIAFLRVGPCLRPVLMTADATLGGTLASDGALVGYGDPLFALEAAG